MKFAEIRWNRAHTCGQTGGHDESNRGCGGYANFSKNQPQNEWKYSPAKIFSVASGVRASIKWAGPENLGGSWCVFVGVKIHYVY